ncbi:diguanylate cyclase [Coprococcus comes]|nr:diguanylate cyclase [Coprococcus comes]
MNKQDQMTMQEAERKMESLREMFQVVRLVDGKMLMDREKRINAGDLSETCQCYTFWKKDKECKNCSSLLALKEQTQKIKFEFLDSQVFQVISRYVEIDGRPYVMEMIQNLDESIQIDQEGYEKLISKLSGYNEKLYTDVLTGIYNRRFFEEEIKKMEDEAGIAVIDLDDFKLHNDTYGHSAGDAALITTANIIKKYIRKTDILIRYGGDEFLLILPSIKKHIFEDKLKLIREKIHDTVVPKYEKMQLSVSIGGAIFREGNIEDAIASADRQMYIAKNYKNMVVTEWDENGKKKEENSASEKLKQQILIVDDSEINREILKEILKEDYRILEAANGEECLEQLERSGTGISLVLLDIVMPEMDGFEVLAAMNQNHWIEDIPVIMISSEDSDSYIRRAYEMGVSDYISRPFDAKIVYQRVLNMIKLYAKQRRLIHLVTRQIYEKERNNRMMIGILSQIVEFRNGESGLHVIHINLITQLLLEQLVKKTGKYQLSWEDRLLIATASALHDIGKIGIDEKILNKPGKLTKEEFEIMKTHTLIGAQMLDNLDMYRNEKLLKLAHEICRWHHERYDGKGYPDGLVGEEIPISAQVVSLADVYDALVSERVYKKAFSHEKALEMIQNGECGTFNPLLLQCMTEAQDKLKTMMEVAEKE